MNYPFGGNTPKGGNMKTSELIAQLANSLVNNGDMDVHLTINLRDNEDVSVEVKSAYNLGDKLEIYGEQDDNSTVV